MLRSLQCLLIAALFALSAPLHALKGYSRSGEPFDKEFSVQILESRVEIYPPGTPCPSEPLSTVLPAFWCVRHCMQLEDGLFASNAMFYDESTYRRWHTQYECSGEVNIVLSDPKKTNLPFALIFEDGGFLEVDLAVDYETRADLPRMLSLTQFIKTIPHWFYEEQKIQYTLELTDGTVWTTPLSDFMCVWPPSSSIIRIGTGSQPLLLNFDEVSTVRRISSKHCLKVHKGTAL